MQTPKQLFDTHALALHRNRALQSAQNAWFLHEHAADCVHERLQEVNRSFNKSAFVGWNPGIWLKFLNSSTITTPDAEILDLKQAAHDLVINGLTLHWANDPVGQLVQMRRALMPDGLMISVMFGGQTLHELRTAFAEAEARIEGGISPRIAPMAEIRDLGGLLQRAGFALPVADSLKFSVEYDTPVHLMNDLRHMGESNAVFARRRSLKRETLAMAAEVYSANYTKSSGRIAATFELVFLTGWAPSDSQQKPLHPGSAQQRLADALGTSEYNPDKKTR